MVINKKGITTIAVIRPQRVKNNSVPLNQSIKLKKDIILNQQIVSNLRGMKNYFSKVEYLNINKVNYYTCISKHYLNY